MKQKSTAILSISLIIGASFNCSAQYQQIDIQETDTCMITYVGTDNGRIKIGHQELKARDKFDVRQTINWVSDEHYLIADNIRTGETYKFCSKEYNEDYNNVLQWYRKKNYLSTKGLDDVDKCLSSTFYMIEDTVRIKSRMPIDNDRYYSIKSIPDNIEIILPYDDKTNEIVIYKQLLNDCNLDVFPIKFHVEYIDETKKRPNIALTNDMTIEYIPIKQ